MIWVLLVFVWLLLGLVGAMVMANKGRSGCSGFILGFLLGPIGLIIAVAFDANRNELEKRALSNGQNRRCPACAEIVRFEARKCRFCGEELSEISPANGENSKIHSLKKISGSDWENIIIILICGIFLLFLIGSIILLMA